MKKQEKNNLQVPRLASQLFSWFCGSAMIEDLFGDMEEMYAMNVKMKGLTKARLIFWKQILSLIFSEAIRRRKVAAAISFRAGTPSMALLYNFFKVSVRNLVKHRLFSMINIVGLAFGMSICLLGITMIYSINQFDQFHTYSDRIYRINTHINSALVNDDFATTAPLVKDRISEYSEQIAAIATINDGFRGEVNINENKLNLSGFYVGSEFLNVFTFPLVAGHPHSALLDPFSIILTEKTAHRLFGHADVLGKNLDIEGKGLFKVTGVMQDYPAASHLQFESLISYPTMEAIDRGVVKRYDDYKFYINSYTYLLLKEDIDPNHLNGPLAEIAAALSSPDESFRLYLQPMTQIVSGISINYEIGPSFDRITMLFFVFLMLLILLPACFNYANLSLARSLKRAKEIGLRKVVGGGRREIFIQFLFETLIITFLSLIGATYIFTVIRTQFLSMIIGAETLDLSIQPPVILAFIAFAICTSILAGILPAIYFSKMKAIVSLKGGTKAGTLFQSRSRNLLTVVQFGLSILFIFGAIAMSSQYHHTLNYNKGFDEANKIVVPLHGVDKEIFRHEYTQHPEVQQIAFSSGVPGMPSNQETWVRQMDLGDSVAVSQMYVDNSFLTMMQFDLKEGMLFIENLNEEADIQLIVNETFIRTMQWENGEVLNRTIELENNKTGRIVGVVADFNHLPVFKEIQPFFFRFNPDRLTLATVLIRTEDVFSTATKFETTWSKLHPFIPFEFNFLKDKLDESYQSLQFQIRIYSFLSFLAVSIACLGLLGMVVFSMENKIKEIGIRKVMGASTIDLTLMLSRGFIKLMALAAVISLPLAFVFFKFMLEQIVYYHQPLGWFEIVASFLALTFLGGGTVISQTLRASKVNPVEHLRYE